MSEKLRALQEQVEAEQKQLELELGGGGGSGDGGAAEPRGTEVTMGGGRNRVAADDVGDGEAERRTLLRKRKAGKAEETSQLSFGKVAAIVGVGVCVALLLLLLLFNGDTKEEFESFVPLSRQQLKQERPHDPCPDPWWIPEQCTSEDRISSRSVWDECDAFFKKHDYDVKYLKKCGIEIKEGKAPKEDKDVKGGRRLLSRGAGRGARRGTTLF